MNRNPEDFQRKQNKGRNESLHYYHHEQWHNRGPLDVVCASDGCAPNGRTRTWGPSCKFHEPPGCTELCIGKDAPCCHRKWFQASPGARKRKAGKTHRKSTGNVWHVSKTVRHPLFGRCACELIMVICNSKSWQIVMNYLFRRLKLWHLSEMPWQNVVNRDLFRIDRSSYMGPCHFSLVLTSFYNYNYKILQLQLLPQLQLQLQHYNYDYTTTTTIYYNWFGPAIVSIHFMEETQSWESKLYEANGFPNKRIALDPCSGQWGVFI